MNYVYHPLESEMYDPDTFVDHNEEILRQLYRDIVDSKVLGEKTNYEDEDEFYGLVGTMMSACVFNYMEHYNGETVPYDESYEKDICDLAEVLVTLVILFHMVDEGVIENTDNGKYRLTDFGEAMANIQSQGL